MISISEDFLSIKGRFVAAFTEQNALTFKYSWNHSACGGSTGSDQWWLMHDDQPQRIISPVTPRCGCVHSYKAVIRHGGFRHLMDDFVLSMGCLLWTVLFFLRGFSEIRDTFVFNDTAETLAPDLNRLPVTVGSEATAEHQFSLVGTGICYTSEPVKHKDKIKDVVKN